MSEAEDEPQTIEAKEARRRRKPTDEQPDRGRRGAAELVHDHLPSLNADQMFAAFRNLVQTSPRQALIAQATLKEAIDEVKGS